MEDWKIKIAVLWLVYEVGSIWIGLIEHYIPGFIEEAVAQTTPESVLLLVVIEMILPVMAFLSLVLKNSVNRWVNMIVGIVFAVFLPMGVIGFPVAYSASVAVIAIVQFVAVALIIWYAWKSKQKT